MQSIINYNKARNWIVEEVEFNSAYLGKCESIMCLGNGYLGLRSATEEKYPDEKRDYFVAGTFNKFNEDEVSELPNAADIIAIELFFDGERFSLEQGKVLSYSRQLNLKKGELTRRILWESPKGNKIQLAFYRFVSLENIHLVGQKVEITSLDKDLECKVISGIDGCMTNNGSQHFSDGDKRFYEKRYMQFVQTTTQSKIDFVHNTCLSFFEGKKEEHQDQRIFMERRKLYSEYKLKIVKGVEITLEKISNVYTSRDLENLDLTLSEIKEHSLLALKDAVGLRYNRLIEMSANYWEEKVWSKALVDICSNDEFDQLAILFAQYHLEIMTPDHDNRMNIGAKGLSGEGYKGHTFWDMEIFILPYFIYSFPEIAKKLLEYRYLSLEGAHKKAKENLYEGAQFPWESAWLDDGEVTPIWGAADILTGLPTKIWSGFIEQHITSDVAYAVWQYYMVTADQEFMNAYGYELIFDTAKFWVSRLEFSSEDGLYHINDVVGPDEYKEHVDDNAFTNYMAWWNIKKAIEYYHLLKDNEPTLYMCLEEKLGLEECCQKWIEKSDKIFLPSPRKEDNVLPQDSTYLTLKDIDLTQYKNQAQVGSIFFDYNLEQVNDMQVSKQADVLVLFWLLEDLFSKEVKKANWEYYEKRTLHDSSLSLSTHCILACDMGEYELAYKLFQKASRIDLGSEMKSSDEGIHSASIGGIWQCIVYGFGGVRMLDGQLRIEPHLPEKWSKLSFYLNWKGQKLYVNIEGEELVISNMTQKDEVKISFQGKEHCFLDKLMLKLN